MGRTDSGTRPLQRGELAIFAWGVLGLSMILGQAVLRLLPLALQPIQDGSLTAVGWLAYAASVGVMAYSEGYRGFQTSFCPRAVARAAEIARRGGWPAVLAPVAAGGLVYATRRRLIGSWGLLGGIVVLILLVRMLSQPWRGAVDAGVVVGLSWGIVALLTMAVRALRGDVPDVDTQLPE